jgi:hypothetical protein
MAFSSIVRIVSIAVPIVHLRWSIRNRLSYSERGWRKLTLAKAGQIVF